jgi:hypothetical protein
MVDIIGHERVHQGQNSRRNIEFTLVNPTNRKKYFSNKDEIMAFSWTIANGLFKNNNSIQNAIKELDSEIITKPIETLSSTRIRTPEYKMIWNDIKRNCDEKTLKRYRKYIYMYLEKMFDID